jgi:hypothetical protein
MCQVSNVARVQPDTIKIKSEVRELEKIRLELNDRIKKLRTACREDSMGILRVKSKKAEVNEQFGLLKKGIADLEARKTKTKEQRKLLKDLKQGHTDINSKLIAMEQELNVIEINYKASLDLLISAEKMAKDLTQQLRELRKLLSP